MNKETIKNYWETPDMKRHMLANTMPLSELKQYAQSEISSMKKWGSINTKYKELYETLAHLSKKFVKEECKELSDTYTIVFFAPSIAKFCPRILEMILPPMFDSYDPGFTYNCKVVFDEKSTYIDLVTIQDEIENISKKNKHLKKVEFAYMAHDSKSKLQLSL